VFAQTLEQIRTQAPQPAMAPIHLRHELQVFFGWLERLFSAVDYVLLDRDFNMAQIAEISDIFDSIAHNDTLPDAIFVVDRTGLPLYFGQNLEIGTKVYTRIYQSSDKFDITFEDILAETDLETLNIYYKSITHDNK
jgi:hypothetical protein